MHWKRCLNGKWKRRMERENEIMSILLYYYFNIECKYNIFIQRIYVKYIINEWREAKCQCIIVTRAWTRFLKSWSCCRLIVHYIREYNSLMESLNLFWVELNEWEEGGEGGRKNRKWKWNNYSIPFSIILMWNINIKF